MEGIREGIRYCLVLKTCQKSSSVKRITRAKNLLKTPKDNYRESGRLKSYLQRREVSLNTGILQALLFFQSSRSKVYQFHEWPSQIWIQQLKARTICQVRGLSNLSFNKCAVLGQRSLSPACRERFELYVSLTFIASLGRWWGFTSVELKWEKK